MDLGWSPNDILVKVKYDKTITFNGSDTKSKASQFAIVRELVHVCPNSTTSQEFPNCPVQNLRVQLTNKGT